MTCSAKGAVTITELLVVLVVSMILLTVVWSGQTFVQRLAHNFFSTTSLESEARLLLQMLEEDFDHTETFRRVSENSWELHEWLGGKTTYRFSDSVVWRNDKNILGPEVQVGRFDMFRDTMLINMAREFQSEKLNLSNRSTYIRVTFEISRDKRTLEFQATHQVQKRAPGS